MEKFFCVMSGNSLGNMDIDCYSVTEYIRFINHSMTIEKNTPYGEEYKNKRMKGYDELIEFINTSVIGDYFINLNGEFVTVLNKAVHCAPCEI